MVVAVVDPGVDDALALAVLAASQVPLEAVIATAGNVDVEIAATVAARMAAALRLDCEVLAARALTLVARPELEGKPPVHGDDGLGGQVHRLPPAAPPPAHRHEVLDDADVFASGPLTGVAAALDAGARPAGVLWMGGAVRGGNVSASAEFNAWCDPASADRVLCSGVPVDVVPLDVTTRVRLDDGDLRRWEETGGLAAVLAAACRTMLRSGEAVPHDAVAAIALLRPELFTWRTASVRCDTSRDHTKGALLVDDPATDGVHRVAIAVEAEVVHDLILEAVASR